MKLRVKSPLATKVVLIDDNISTKQLIEQLQIEGVTQSSSITIKNGFPPKAISLEPEHIADLDIKNGDQIIIEFSKENGITEQKGKVNDHIPSVYIENLNKYLILRNIPDDNSCLFNSIIYGTKTATVPELRRVCGEAILSDPETYNDIVLGRSNNDYSNWIMKKDSWGGAIELGILSKYLKIQINCIDIELGSVIKFLDEAQVPEKFINLIYLGIHYDILSINDNLSTEDSDKHHDQCIWSLGTQMASEIDVASNKLVQLLQSKNYSTNTTKFRIRCLDCYKVLVGETGAAKHANEAGHFNFGEVKDS